MKAKEVKFRGKSKRTGEWLYGDLVRNVEGAFAIVPPFEMTTDNLCDRYEVDEKTIGQFIGTTDKNENEIYEGDIIKTDDGLDISGYYEVSYDIGATGFVCVGKDVHCCLSIIEEFSYIEVVGNIYDNKGLLTTRI